MKSCIFSDLSAITENKEVIKNEISTDCWQMLDYEINGICGKMLVAGEETYPQPVILDPKLKGWHRIYISMVNIGFVNRLNIKLTSDKTFASVYTPKESTPSRWAPYEYAQEFFWKCANMNSEKIFLRKPCVYAKNGACVSWLRFEEMSEAEIEEYKAYVNAPKFKNAHYHFDGNEHTMEELNSANDSLIRLSNVDNSDAEICSLEFTSDYDIEDTTLTVMYASTPKSFEKGDLKFRENKKEYYKEVLSYLHGMDIKALAAYRMSLARFGLDDIERIQIGFVGKHPEYYCRTRNGKALNICSYAYPEVWDYVISGFKEMLSYGYDGISLILHRGIMINFEAPVLERFAELYGNEDPRTLPISDSRLNGVWCEFMTEFMSKLRREVDSFAGRRVWINIITDFSPETAKNLGVDIETWAQKGLIDSICQDTMELYEDVSDCMCDDRIDIEKYSAKLKTTEVIRRYHGYDLSKIVNGAKKYFEIAEKYNVKFYGGIFSWHTRPEAVLENQRALKQIGIDNFSVFNYVHLSVHQPLHHSLAHICHDEINKEYCIVNNFRVQSIGDMDISLYNPNWRG